MKNASKKLRKSSFRRSRRQIVAIVMISFLLLFIVTLAMIYILSYQELYQENQDMLEIYVSQYRENGNPAQIRIMGEAPDENSRPKPARNTRYLLSSFYSVEFDENGNPSGVDLGSDAVYTESQLFEAAAYLLDTGQSEGTYGNFVYCVNRDENNTLVAMMDNTLVSDSFTKLFCNTLLLGVVMVVVLLVCAIVLARLIIHPLEVGDRRQRQFISDAGHELKTPVAVIEANAELLEREIGANKWLDNIRSESRRMTGLVNELLTLARTELETPQMEPLNFSNLVMGMVLPFESVAFEMGRELDCRIDDDITVEGNEAQLSQLVSILMDNALSHSEGEGNIAISLHSDKAGAVLTISNPGFIPENNRNEIFARFFRVETNRSDTGHYGLGLTIAKKIVTEHNGEINVTCSDKQVLFSVHLPVKSKIRHSKISGE